MYNSMVSQMKTKKISFNGTSIKRISNWLYTSTPYILIALVSVFVSRVKLMDEFLPFSVALVGAYLTKGKRSLLIAISAVLGLLTNVGMIKYEYIMAIVVLIGVYKLFCKTIKFSKVEMAIISSLIVMLIRLIMLSQRSFYTYDILMMAFEGAIVFSATYIFNYGISVFFKYDEDLVNEEIIAMIILSALVIAGIGDINIVGYGIKNIVSIFLIIAIGYRKGPAMGATIGIIVGLIIALNSPFMYVTVAVLGFCGLVCGLFRELGKIMSAISFVMSYVIISYYSIEAVEILIKTGDIVVGVSLFFIFGKYAMNIFDKAILLNKNKLLSRGKYHERMKSLTKKRLIELSEVFDELSATFDKVASDNTYFQNKDVTKFIDNISKSVCKDCNHYRQCWSGDFYNTYKSMFDLMNIMELKGLININDLPKTVKRRCIHPEKIVDKCNYLFDLYKLNYTWMKKVQESRQLVSQQLKGVSSIMVDLSSEIEQNIKFKEDVENSIFVKLKKNNFAVTEVYVTESNMNKFEIIVETKNSLDKEEVAALTKIVSSIVGYRLKRDKYFYVSDLECKTSKIKLVKANRYNAITKISRISNAREEVSGDSYVFGERKNNYFTILSDGMGVGYKANIESSTVVSLLEKFLEAGYKKEVALKTINSILILKSNEEMLTTLDMSIVDLYTGKGQFVKIGSAPTFIKRGSNIISINSSSLPIGILKEVDIYVYEEQVKSGDIIIMLSDGVLDANSDSDNKEEWLMDIIRNIDSVNPQTVADKVLDAALEVVPANKRDDMTVLTTKVWKTTR